MPVFSALRRIFSNAKGNVAILFGLAIVPVIGAMGVAVDYSLANMARTRLQAAIDNTALMLSKELPLTQTQLNTNGWQIFQANLGSSPLVFQQSDLTFTQGSGVITIDINTTYNTQLARVLQLVGMNTSFPVTAHTEVMWGNTRLRVALVLDNTGSMSQSNKITALQTATTNLLTQLHNAAQNNGDVYVSIIPFVKDVNIGSTNYAASYIDWTSWDATTGQTAGTCSISGFTSSSSCTSAGTCSIAGRTSQNHCGTCSKSQYTSRNQCQSNNGTWTPATWTPGTWTPDHSQWNGCVMDRGVSGGPGTNADYDQNTNAPTSSVTASLFPAEQYSYCPQQMIGLSYDWNALQTEVNNMSPNGSTNQPIGLVWGWQSLVGGGPLTAPAMDPNYTYNQVIILLTDGLNTQDRWYGDGVNTSTQVDQRMYYQNGSTVTGTCKNIKDAGITIYTVQVNTDNSPTSTLLQNCASDASKFFLLTSSSQIVTTFQQIGTQLSNLRVAQ
ncbi:MAG TPA: TadE/TadG family type IV pilus assembly protein [Xanthobacteraceae bacterium]|nr:TadE/TadG family type IV pilus assembly protein [Xanthobacteraceae bacterium]